MCRRRVFKQARLMFCLWSSQRKRSPRKSQADPRSSQKSCREEVRMAFENSWYSTEWLRQIGGSVASAILISAILIIVFIGRRQRRSLASHDKVRLGMVAGFL